MGRYCQAWTQDGREGGFYPHAAMQQRSNGGCYPHAAMQQGSNGGFYPHAAMQQGSNGSFYPHAAMHQRSNGGFYPHAAMQQGCNGGCYPPSRAPQCSACVGYHHPARHQGIAPQQQTPHRNVFDTVYHNARNGNARNGVYLRFAGVSLPRPRFLRAAARYALKCEI